MTSYITISIALFLLLAVDHVTTAAVYPQRRTGNAWLSAICAALVVYGLLILAVG